MNFIDYKDPENSLSKALSTSLPALGASIAQQLMERRKRQEQAFGLQAALGVDPGKASALSQLDPQTLAAYVKQEIQRPDRERYASLLSQIMPNQQGGQVSGRAIDPTLNGIVEPLPSDFQTEPVSGQATGMPKFDVPSQISANELRFAADQINQGLNRAQKDKALAQQKELSEKKMGLTRELAGMKSEEKEKARQFTDVQRSKKESAAIAKENRERVAKAYKGLEPEISKLSKEIEIAKADLNDLNLVESIVNTGQAVTGAERKIAEKLGLEDVWTNDVSQLMDKTINGMLKRSMQNVPVGGKMTNEILKSLRTANVTMRNTKLGAKSIIPVKKLEIANAKVIAQAQLNYLKDLKERGIEPPPDWRIKAIERVNPVLDANGQKMLDRVWTSYYREKGVADPKKIYKDYPVSNLPDGKHIRWRGIVHELINGHWLPAPDWKQGDPNVYGEDNA